MDKKGHVTRLIHIISFIGSTTGDFSDSVANDRAWIFILSELHRNNIVTTKYPNHGTRKPAKRTPKKKLFFLKANSPQV